MQKPPHKVINQSTVFIRHPAQTGHLSAHQAFSLAVRHDYRLLEGATLLRPCLGPHPKQLQLLHARGHPHLRSLNLGRARDHQHLRSQPAG